ncbi:MAG TPA: DUF819 domain-containing protein [Hellea balneolensis]|uniref:DUF819 domain-containing protein n=1 Tax=Hellea balneolensis TaxID=287478 RepID=A0A7V5NW53_9PROT|nr:DUF819 domain-containing protein [Hellea balneolensis]
MITNGLAYLAVLFLTGGLIAWIEGQGKFRLFKILPGIVILYFLIMLFSTLGLWHKTDSINATYKAVKDNLLPMMIFLLLLKGDIRQIAALGPKLIFTFLLASTSIILGFVLTFLALKAWLPEGAWMTFAPLAGSWLGGSGNMAAVQGALSIPDAQMTNALLMDSIDYALWVMLLLACVPFAARFNRWSGGNTRLIDEIGAKLEADSEEKARPINTGALLLLIGLGLSTSAASQYLGGFLPTTDFLSHKTWAILIATVFGVIAAMTPIARVPGSGELGSVLLYGIVALIASRANFGELTQAPLFILAGFMILAFHGLIMIVAAKLFRLDLFSLGVASLANVGGVASAPILAAAYSRALIPVGILMALLGYILGTGGGLVVGKILLVLSGG